MKQTLKAIEIIEHIRLLNTADEESALIQEIKQSNTPIIVSFINAHASNMAWENEQFRQFLLGSDILLRDGIGMAIQLRQLGIEPGLNMNGTDLIPKLIDEFSKAPLAFCGTKKEIVGHAAEAVKNKFDTESVVVCDGFQPDEHYLHFCRQHKPRCVVLGMGMPKQERIADLLKKSLDFPIVIINGGAILDFLGGSVKRAPSVVKTLRLEWVFRLAQEPRRLWKRYILGNPKFLYRTMRIKSDYRATADNNVQTDVTQ